MPRDEDEIYEEDIQLSDSDPKFVPRETDDVELWEAIEILKEKGKSYLVSWAGDDPKTGRPWAPSWTLKTDCTPAMVYAWKQKKAEKKAQAATRKSANSTKARKSRTSTMSKGSRPSRRSTSSTIDHAGASTSSTAGEPVNTKKRRRSPVRDSIPPITTIEETRDSPARKKRKFIQPAPTRQRKAPPRVIESLKEEEEEEEEEKAEGAESEEDTNPRLRGKRKGRAKAMDTVVSDEHVQPSDEDEMGLPQPTVQPMKFGPPRKSTNQGRPSKPILKKVPNISQMLDVVITTPKSKARAPLRVLITEEDQDDTRPASDSSPRHHASPSPKRSAHKNRPYLMKIVKRLNAPDIERLRQFDGDVDYVSPSEDENDQGPAFHNDTSFTAPAGLLVVPSRQSSVLPQQIPTPRKLSPEIPLDESFSNSLLSLRRRTPSPSPPPPDIAFAIPRMTATTTKTTTPTAPRHQSRTQSRAQLTTEVVPGTETQSSTEQAQPQQSKKAQTQLQKPQSTRALTRPKPSSNGINPEGPAQSGAKQTDKQGLQKVPDAPSKRKANGTTERGGAAQYDDEDEESAPASDAKQLAKAASKRRDRVEKPLKPIPRLSPSTFAPHLATSSAGPSDDERRSDEESQDEQNEERIESFSSPEKSQEKVRKKRLGEMAPPSNGMGALNGLQRGKELAGMMKAQNGSATLNRKVVKSSSIVMETTQVSRDSIQEFSSSNDRQAAAAAAKDAGHDMRPSGGGLVDGATDPMARTVKQMEDAYLDLSGGAADTSIEGATAGIMPPAPVTPIRGNGRPANDNTVDDSATYEDDEEALVASQIYPSPAKAIDTRFLREEEEETTQDVLAALQQPEDEEIGPPPPPSSPRVDTTAKRGQGEASAGVDRADFNDQDVIDTSFDQRMDEDWSRAPNATIRQESSQQETQSHVPETQQLVLNDSSREEDSSQIQSQLPASFDRNKSEGLDSHQPQHLGAALALLNTKSVEIAKLESMLAAAQRREDRLSNELQALRSDYEQLLAASSSTAAREAIVRGDASATGVINSGDDSQGFVQGTQASSQVTTDQSQIFKDLELIRVTLTQERIQWDEDRAKLESTVKSAQAAKAMLEKDVDFFRDQYAQASGFVTSVREENRELEEKARIAESQAMEGVAMIKATYETRVKALEADKNSWRKMTELFAEKDKRTNDEVRRMAAEYPELECKLELLNAELKEERASRDKKQMLLEESELQVMALKEEVEKLQERLQKWEAAARDAQGVTAQTMDQPFEGGVLVYPCRWHPSDSGLPCRSVFLTTEALQAHILTSGHLDD